MGEQLLPQFVDVLTVNGSEEKWLIVHPKNPNCGFKIGKTNKSIETIKDNYAGQTINVVEIECKTSAFYRIECAKGNRRQICTITACKKDGVPSLRFKGEYANNVSCKPSFRVEYPKNMYTEDIKQKNKATAEEANENAN